MTAQKVQMRLAPGGDVVVVVTVGDRSTDHQQKDLRQGMDDAADCRRIVDYGKMIKQNGQPGFRGQWGGAGDMRRDSESEISHRIDPKRLCYPLSHEFEALVIIASVGQESD
jgi:hypothetical protein